MQHLAQVTQVQQSLLGLMLVVVVVVAGINSCVAEDWRCRRTAANKENREQELVGLFRQASTLQKMRLLFKYNMILRTSKN